MECSLQSTSSTTNVIEKFGITPEDEFLLQWRRVIDAIEGGASVSFGFDSALRQAAFCAAIEKSASKKSYVLVER